MNHDESIFQSQVCSVLTLNRIFYFAVPNELLGGAKNAARRMAQFRAMGLRPGIADLILVDDSGRIFFLELKTPVGRLSESQKAFQAFCLKKGWPYAVARTLEEVKTVLDGWGL